MNPPTQAATPAKAPQAMPKTGNGITTPSRRGGSGRVGTDVIVQLGDGERQAMDEAVEMAHAAGSAAERVLVTTGAITEAELARAVAERFGLDHLDLQAYRVDPDAAKLVSPAAIKRYQAVPVAFAGDRTLLVAMGDPGNVLAVDDIAVMPGYEVRPAVASPADIEFVVGRLADPDWGTGNGAAPELDAAEPDEEERGPAQPEGPLYDLPATMNFGASGEDASVIQLVQRVISEAVERGASDIHFEPQEEEMRVRYRIDGVLTEAAIVPVTAIPAVTSRIKILSDLDIAERRIPQDGRVSTQSNGRQIDLRVATLPAQWGEKVVMRILDTSKAMVGIEQPVEYQLEGLTQVQVNNKAGLTFAAGLRSMMRSDPDIIMVGEIRDHETAQIAIESALTGHLVLSTLHTNDAPGAVSRLIEMGIEPFLVGSAVDCVVAQRLARLLCEECKKRVTLPAEVMRANGFNVGLDLECYEPVGCARCGGGGYKGRIGLYEVMWVSETIRSLAVAREPAETIAHAAVHEGMMRLREDGLEKVRRGLTSIAEIARVAGTR